MKKLKYLPVGVLLLFALVGCNNFDEVAEEFNNVNDTEVLESLLGTWVVDQVIYSGFDATSVFQGFTLTFGEDGSWSAENGEPLFNSDGTWQFASDELDKLDMDGVEVDLEFTIDREKGSTMTLELIPPERAIGGRSEGLTEPYVLTFSKL